MAGTPKKRAKQAAAQAVQQAAPPDAIPNASVAAMRTRARAPARAVPPVGPTTRAAVDAGQASTLSELARHIHPGYTLRLERLRPVWCAGWVEDIAVDTSSVGELYNMVRAEFGGSHYRVVVLGNQESVLYEGRLTIASPPCVGGLPINRAKWEQLMQGVERSPARERSPANEAVTDRSAGDHTLVRMLWEQSRELSKIQAESSRATVEAMQTMLAKVMSQQQPARSGGSFLEHLGEFVQAQQAMERVSKVFGRARRDEADASADNPDVMQQAFFQAVIAKLMGGPGPTTNGVHAPQQVSGIIPDSRVIPRR